MLSAEKMDRVSAVILRNDLDEVLDEVVRLGVLHPVRIEEAEEWARDWSATGAEQLSAEYAKRRQRLRELMEESPARPPESAHGPLPEHTAFQELDAAIAAIESRLNPLRDALAAAQARRAELTALTEQLAVLLPANLSLHLLSHSTFLVTQIGSLSANRIPELRAALAEVPAIIYPYRMEGEFAGLVCIVLRRDKPLLEAALRDAGFRDAALPQDLNVVTRETQSSIQRELATLKTETSRIEEELSRTRAAMLPEVRTLMQQIDGSLILLNLKEHCRVSDKTSVFTGWVPSAMSGDLVAALHEKTGGRVLVDVVAADALETPGRDEVDVPVWFRLPRILEPYSLLVAGYGVPSYRMLDPTLFVAFSFLIMFGAMFGDVGHGLVLAGAGLFMLKKNAALRDAGKLILSCGGVSMLFGLLYGSVFGFEELIPALWVKPLEHTNALFVAAITFGALLISAGLVLNIAHMIRRRALFRDFFDVSGPLTAVAYWAAAGLAVKLWLADGESALTGPLLWLVILPLAAFFAKGPVLALAGFQDKAIPEGVVGYVMECAVKILEVLMGCLANTVSFIRVAAFGLAHAGLFVAVFSIADAVSGAPGGTIISWIVLVVGNAVVIVLEGIVVTIQAVRLEYYEFFGKFFSRMGTPYQPVSFSSAVLNRTD
ncbi:MAG: hypothetical protein IT364_26185 [Candidatus Hydrogenedentes bacterium]|nr:hypothetical protein [Candidatus Hydrogenedentota bacterium]